MDRVWTKSPDMAAAPRLAADRFRAETVTTREAFDALRTEWNTLLERSRAGSIFLTWEWIAAWLEAVRPDAQLQIVVLRDFNGELAAIGPFYRARLMFLGALPHRWLRILGDAPGGGEYGDIIARADIEEEAKRRVLAHLLAQDRRWDGIWLANTGPTSASGEAVGRIARELGLRVRSREACFSRIPLPASFEEYLSRLPGKIRYQVRRGVERMEGERAARLVSCSDEESSDAMLGELFRLHQARWQRRGAAGVLQDPRMQAFYRALGRQMGNSERRHLDLLEADGRIVAAQIGFAYGGVFYELQRGFDPEFPNIPAGVGAALRSMVLRRCMERGLRFYDFLGGFNEDKQRAGAERMSGRDVMIVRPTLRNAVLCRWDLWPTGRYLRFAGQGRDGAGRP
jgi:CelD/BcsL family acetyltransferase involved in cellulose biosynthesis